MLYIDRHLVHEVTSPQAFEGLRTAGRKVRRPDLTLAVADHNVPTTNRAAGITDPESAQQIATLEANAREFGVEYLSMDDIRQGIVHIVGPEQGWTLPGTTIVCGDSHTSTHGAFGALAFGIGTSEVEHVLATQTLLMPKSKNMRVTVEGALPLGVTAKDMALAIIARIGTAGGTGYVIEYAGEAVKALSMEGRMTLCNMTIEAGARAGLIAPDETTFAYVAGRPRAPKAAAFEGARMYWRTLKSDDDAKFDAEIAIDAKIHRADGDLGHEPGAGAAHHRARARSQSQQPTTNQRAGHRTRARLYGSDAGHGARGCEDRSRLHRLLHQRPHRRSARGGRDRERPESGGACGRDGRAGFGPRESAGRRRRPRRDFPGSGLRMARAGLLDVPCHERRQAGAGRALRLDLEPQFRRPSGPRRTYASRQPCDGGGGGDRGPSDGCAGVSRSQN